MVEGRRPTQAQRGWVGFLEEAQPELSLKEQIGAGAFVTAF